MENDALIESTEAGGNGDGNGDERPVYGFKRLGDSKTTAEVGENFVNTYKSFPWILRNKWRDFGEQGVLMQVRGLTSGMSFYCKEIQSVNPKGTQPWILIGSTEAEAEAPILWPPDMKSRLIRKDPDAWKDWRQEEKGMTEEGMVGWHHRYNGHEFEQTPGQGNLAFCSSWGHKELDTTEQLNNNNCFYKKNCAAPGNLTFMWLLSYTHPKEFVGIYSVQFSSVTQSCPTLCNPMDCSTPGLPVHHQLLEFTKNHVHWVGDAIQPSHPLLSSSPPAHNPSQHQSLFQWVNSLHEVAKVLEFQL